MSSLQVTTKRLDRRDKWVKLEEDHNRRDDEQERRTMAMAVQVQKNESGKLNLGEDWEKVKRKGEGEQKAKDQG